ncbi:MAG: hypothetical protein EA376_13025 [Phycisphaeraceae bacterium]|nr:MAG: hypothetical protein EA376_13025 [Phycisphaeraceae bacterium]
MARPDPRQESSQQNTEEPRREGVVDRRSGIDRRDFQDAHSGFDRRRGVGRRLSDFAKAAEEGELTQEQFLFVAAIDAFKRANNKTFPTWTEVLEVIRLLGYRKTCSSELGVTNAEDWTEAPDAESNVRTIRSEKAA